MNPLRRQVAQAGMLLAFSVSALAGAGEEAGAWLARMADAMNQQSYQGTFVYMKGDAVETMRITHVVDERGIRERLYSVDGPHREIIRDFEGVRCVLSDDKAVFEDALVTGPIYPEIPLDQWHGDDIPYRFETGGKARMAGYQARRVAISPRDEYRYGYELWLEEDSALLLKWVLYDRHRNALAKLMFTSLVTGDQIDLTELESDTPVEDFVHLPNGMPVTNPVKLAPRWQPSNLPPGFRLTAHNLVEDAGINVFEHLVYSDGLASVSVYIEDESREMSSTHGSSRLGTANAFSRHVGRKHVTVIGEVPALTVRTIGSAVAPVLAAD